MAEEIVGYHRNLVCRAEKPHPGYFPSECSQGFPPICVSLMPNPVMLLGTPSGEQMGIPKLVLHFPAHPAPHLCRNYTITSKASPTYQYIQFGIRLIASIKWGGLKNSSVMYMLLRNNQNTVPPQCQFNLHVHVTSLLLSSYNFCKV